MNEDRVQGKIEDLKGRAKRQAGEWTGDTKAVVEGAAQQVKGKVQHGFGKAKDKVKEAASAVSNRAKESQAKAAEGVRTNKGKVA